MRHVFSEGSPGLEPTTFLLRLPKVTASNLSMKTGYPQAFLHFSQSLQGNVRI